MISMISNDAEYPLILGRGPGIRHAFPLLGRNDRHHTDLRAGTISTMSGA